jgi:hypothetical protein
LDYYSKAQKKPPKKEPTPLKPKVTLPQITSKAKEEDDYSDGFVPDSFPESGKQSIAGENLMQARLLNMQEEATNSKAQLADRLYDISEKFNKIRTQLNQFKAQAECAEKELDTVKSPS